MTEDFNNISAKRAGQIKTLVLIYGVSDEVADCLVEFTHMAQVSDCDCVLRNEGLINNLTSVLRMEV